MGIEIRERILINDDRSDMPPVKSTVYEFGSGEAITAFSDKQIIIDGCVCIGHNKSQKWGEQLEIEIFSRNFQRKQRYKSKSFGVWHRSEIFMPINHIDALIEVLQRIKINLRAHTNLNKSIDKKDLADFL